MSTGGVFILLTNDGRQDKLLNANSVLINRIAAIRKARGPNSLPTLADIEQTHILFVNAQYRPFVAIAYEYQKVSPGTGSNQLGSKLQFAIPQFGDFFYDMCFHLVMLTPGLTSSAVPATADEQPQLAWCEWLGERVMSLVEFEVNGNPIDKYTSDVMALWRKCFVTSNKLDGYKRCVGQEVPSRDKFTQDGDLSTATVNIEDISFGMDVYDGNQTWKVPSNATFGTVANAHGSIEMFIPLIFWFNRDVSTSIPSVAIPYGQRFINITLAAQNQLLFALARANGGTLTIGDVGNLTTAELYINNIFLNKEVHDIYIKRVSFTLVRVWKYQTTNINSASSSVRHNQLKFPTEFLIVGVRPTDQSGTNAASRFAWHRFTDITRTDLAPADYAPLATNVAYNLSADTVDNLTVTAQGIPLYNDFPSGFYNCYTPFRYAPTLMQTPEDQGVLFVPFCLLPGTYQPSGHINLSRAREFDVNYTSSVVASDDTADLVTVAQAINFLLVSSGNAVLRYAT